MTAPFVLSLSSRAASVSAFGVGLMGYGTLSCISRLSSKNKTLFGENEKLKTELEGARKWGAVYQEKASTIEAELTKSREEAQKAKVFFNQSVERDNRIRTVGSILMTSSLALLAMAKML